MAQRRIKKKDHERLDDSTISRVISFLEDEKSPITKKEACEHLNINYNTQRLNRIINEYKEKQEYRKKRFKENRGKPFSDFEKKDIVISYLKGDSITSIANANYRTVNAIKKVLKEQKVPPRTSGGTYQKPDIIPDENLTEEHEPKSFVWSARYNCVAEIRRCIGEHSFHGKIYRIYVFGKHNEFASQPWYELGTLDVLKNFQISEQEFTNTEKPNFAYRID